MVEDCRYCGNCCYTYLDLDGCVFLDFEPKDSKFSCLIYKNNARSSISIQSLEGLFDNDPQKHQESLEYLFKNLLNMLGNNYKSCCYTHDCRRKILYNEISVDIRKSKDRHEAATLFQKRAEQVREMIPNFHDLVDILNRNIDGYCIFEDESTGQKPKEQ